MLSGKIKILFFLFLVIFFLILFKLFLIQVINPDEYANSNYLKSIKTPATRGKIFDINGQTLVDNIHHYLLFADPKEIKNKQETEQKLNRILNLGEATLEAKLNRKGRYSVLKKDCDEEEKKVIANLKIKGLGFKEEAKRIYPEASVAAHLLGFVGKDRQGNDQGYFGIEGYYNKELSGMPGFLKTERDPLGRPILIGTQEKINPEEGSDLYLTIDLSVQNMVKKKLAVGLEKYQAKQGCIIVMEPSTGKIMALSCLPDFDASHYNHFNEELFKNSAISDLYEPGSTFKPLIVAAALDQKAIKPDETFNEEGPIKIGDYKIRTWNNQYSGEISTTQVLEKSSNVGMVLIGRKLGDNRLYKTILQYGFGQKTGIDLQGEVSGNIKKKNSWYPIDYATATFGQGIAISPIQMITAFSSIVNGGWLMRPYVVDRIVNRGKQELIKPKIRRRVVSGKTSIIIRKMLLATVEHGEVKWDIPSGYQIGGKTGTAQIPIKGHYDPNKTIASFIGFAPIDKPKFVCLVILKEPQASPWGSETAAPLFFSLAKDLIVYYNISPTN